MASLQNAAILFIFFIVVFTAAWLARRLRSPGRSTLLLVGPPDAGKTTLFLQLVHGSTLQGTVASMQANSGPLMAKVGAGLSVVDMPGHPKVRREWEAHVPTTCGIIFVLDSVDFLPKRVATAEQLYDVLTFPEVVSRRIPVLIACNKADLGSRAHSLEFVKRRLEKELEELRESRADLDRDCGRDARPLAATPGESFTFEEHSALSHCPVIFAATASNSQDGIADVLKFVGTRL